jgi:hypothetical protein
MRSLPRSPCPPLSADRRGQDPRLPFPVTPGVWRTRSNLPGRRRARGRSRGCRGPRGPRPGWRQSRSVETRLRIVSSNTARMIPPSGWYDCWCGLRGGGRIAGGYRKPGYVRTTTSTWGWLRISASQRSGRRPGSCIPRQSGTAEPLRAPALGPWLAPQGEATEGRARRTPTFR